MKRPSNRTLALAAVATGVGAGAVATRRRRRRRDTPVDLRTQPLDQLALPDGREREVVVSDGCTISLTEMGPESGPVIVLIHGYVNERRVWALVAERLVEAGHRVIAYDQRGHGRSTIGSSETSIDRLGHDLYELLHALDLNDVVIAGHSMGGMATQAMLIHHPDASSRVRNVVLVATGASGIGLPPFAQALGDIVTGFSGGDRFLARAGIGTAVVRAAFGKGPDPVHVLATRDMLLATPPSSRRAFLGAMHAMDLRPGLPGVALPTSIIVGTLDTLTPPSRARHIAGAIAGSTLEVLPGRGHMLPFEAPDEVTHLIELAAKAA